MLTHLAPQRSLPVFVGLVAAALSVINCTNGPAGDPEDDGSGGRGESAGAGQGGESMGGTHASTGGERAQGSGGARGPTPEGSGGAGAQPECDDGDEQDCAECGTQHCGADGTWQVCARKSSQASCSSSMLATRTCDDSGHWQETACDKDEMCSEGTCGLADGALCEPGAACLSGACLTFFIDEDGDGFGTGTTGKSFCTSPPPDSEYTASANGDCCQIDERVYPGAEDFHGEQHACGGFDWNCDDVEEPTALHALVLFPTEVDGEVCNPQGWIDIVPACGESSTWRFSSSSASCPYSGSDNIVLACR
jgi:hypothetical protein